MICFVGLLDEEWEKKGQLEDVKDTKNRVFEEQKVWEAVWMSKSRGKLKRTADEMA